MKKSLISINITTGNYVSFVKRIMDLSSGKSSYTCIANVHMLVEAHKSESFAKIVNGANITTPDGMPLTWGLKLLHGVKQERVAGMDLLPDILTEAAKQAMPVYFYGGTEQMLNKIKLSITKIFPLLNVAGTCSPPFRSLNSDEIESTAELINESGAKIVFVILGCPKQEVWMGTMKDKINAMMIGVGGALPVLLGFQKRAPKWMQNSGLEWLYRFIQEPKRLFKRYAVTNTTFIYLLLKEFVRIKIFRRKPELFSIQQAEKN